MIEGQGTAIAFVHFGTPEQVAELFEAIGGSVIGSVARVADHDQHLYKAFELRSGSILELMGPAAIAAGTRAFLKGFRPGKVIGDVRRMPGAFLIYRGQLLREHRPKFNGELPNVAEMARRPDAYADMHSS